MSRRPWRSCWRRGRSLIGMAVVVPVGVRVMAGDTEEGADAVAKAGVGVAVAASVEVGIEGFADVAALVAAAVVVCAAVVGEGVGRGWDMGVS